MSNRKKIKTRPETDRRTAYQPPKRYTSFNIFTRDCKNQVVFTEQPMTIEQAQYHFGALSISGID